MKQGFPPLSAHTVRGKKKKIWKRFVAAMSPAVRRDIISSWGSVSENLTHGQKGKPAATWEVTFDSEFFTINLTTQPCTQVSSQQPWKYLETAKFISSNIHGDEIRGEWRCRLVCVMPGFNMNPVCNCDSVNLRPTSVRSAEPSPVPDTNSRWQLCASDCR